MLRLGRVVRTAAKFQHWRCLSSVTPLVPPSDPLPDQCDVLIIGGGGMGASTAYWLGLKAKKEQKKLSVLVVERDACYTSASTVLSVGGLRQQFSLAENIQMSLYGYEFIMNSEKYLGDVDLNFKPNGYLVLASSKGAQMLARNSKFQNELGARNELLDKSGLAKRFPWLSTENIELGCHGLNKEGWFDPWALLMGFKQQARAYGAQFVNAEVCGFEWNGNGGLSAALVSSDNPKEPQRKVNFNKCVLSAGAQSGSVARLAGIGDSNSTNKILRTGLPVEPRKRYVYVFNTQGKNCPGLATPLTIDPDGTYFRRDGLTGNFLCGRSPCDAEEPECHTLDVDHDYFETDIWPTLATRVPAFESIKVQSSWAGYYDHNCFDANGVIGKHPYYQNFYIAAGFSGHGIQQTPAVGRAISELILEGRYQTIDLSRLCFERLIDEKPLLEDHIV